MAFNPYLGRSKAWLETELEVAQKELASARIPIQVGSGEILIRSQPEHSLRQRIRDLQRALNLLDPEAYPAASITPVSQTKAYFT